MRFIGNKDSLLKYLYQIVVSTGITKGTFFDFFSGTTSVGRFFKEKGFKVISSDLLYFSYVLQRAYIQNNKEPQFKKLLRLLPQEKFTLFSSPLEMVLNHLNKIEGMKGFIYKNYTIEGTRNEAQKRMFFIPENGMQIDSIRNKIEEWKKEKLINDPEYFILLACLIETVPYYSNISGVYAAFLKKYDPRAIKKINLKQINICKSKYQHKVYNTNSLDLINKVSTDILYLDPPYNGRQYGPNYHLLETIARYDNPLIKGVAGLRDCSDLKSDFCNSIKALLLLNQIVQNAKYKFLMLSYNSEGIMSKNDIFSTLSKYGRVRLVEMDYRRFKSNNNGEAKIKKKIQEQVYLLRRE